MDVQGNGQRWLKVRDLTRGVTYFFRVQARTVSYGPELQANVTAGPAEGKWPRGQTGRRPRRVGPSPASPFRDRPHSGNRAGRRGAGMDVGLSGSTASRRPASRGPPRGGQTCRANPWVSGVASFGLFSGGKKN